MEKTDGNAFSVKVALLKKNALVPAKQSIGAAGYDLCACLTQPLRLAPMERAAVPTGIALEIPPGYEGQVRPRSGLARNAGITTLNAPGTIDSDYRGEIAVILINLGSGDVTIENGDRIAQLVFAPALNAVMDADGALSPTERGDRGFGSTGV
jgi:dUTP pyrophosphatase